MASDVRGVAAMAMRQPVSVATTLFPDPGTGGAVVRVRACPIPPGDTPTVPADGDEIEIGDQARHLTGWHRHQA
jgi:hypothetical protein